MNAVIMAAGSSKRMEQNKLLMKYKDSIIIEYVIDVIKSIEFSRVLLVGSDNQVLNMAEKHGLEVIENLNSHKGQSESIKLAVDYFNNKQGYMFFCGDQPFIDKENLNKLLIESDLNKEAIIVPTFKGRRGSPVIFPYGLKDQLSNLQGDNGGREVIKHYNVIKFVEVDNELFLKDIDTMEEYKMFIEVNNYV